MNTYKKIYFLGIKGVGMATLACVAREAGFEIAGSDVAQEFITDKILKERQIKIFEGFDPRNVEEFIGETPAAEVLFITTGAHGGFDNPEAEFARNKKIKVISHGQAVGLFMEGTLFGRKFEGVSVSGAHGKTTISGMIAYALTKIGRDPSFTVGTSEITLLGAAGHFGQGNLFVAEADEYVSEARYDPTPKFLYQKPNYLVINNIDFDHPDVYKSIEDIELVFVDFVRQNASATLIVNGDDAHVLNVIKKALPRDPKIIKYGTGEACEFRIMNFKEEGLVSSFQVMRASTLLGDFTLSVPGYHNAKNSLAVIALMIELGVSVVDIQKSLSGFAGVARRFEKVGECESGALVFDDYAHHPEEIKKTLEAAAAAFPEEKITVIFQAHTFERTQALLSEFASSFSSIDQLIILPTFSSMRDAGHADLAQDQGFVEKIRVLQPNTVLIETQQGVVEYLVKNAVSGVIITMGAGDVYKVAYELVHKKT